MKRAGQTVVNINEPASPEARQNLASWYTTGVSDALGDRLLMFDNTSSDGLELLRFKRYFAETPGFEDALRRRVEALSRFDHPSFARVRAVEWLGGQDLALVSTHTTGRRLSEVLGEARGPQLATELIRQLTPALAALHQQGPDVAHGLLTPERIVITPEGRLIIVEHVLSTALDSLRLSAERLRVEFGIAVPPAEDPPKFDARSDVRQLGYLALSLMLGRSIGRGSSPESLLRLLNQDAGGGAGGRPAPAPLRKWLEQALELGPQTFASAQAAQSALNEWEADRDIQPVPRRSLSEFHAPAETRFRVAADPPDFNESDFDFADEDREQRLATSPGAAPSSLTDHATPVVRMGTGEAEPRGAATFEELVARPLANDGPKVEPFVPASPQRRPVPAPVPVAAAAPVPLPAPARSRTSGWLMAGLAGLSLVEAGVIAFLLVTRPVPSGTPATPSARPTPAPPTPVVAAPTPAPPTPDASAAATGRLEVTSDPPGARVSIDGTARGATPLAIALPPGDHNVVVSVGSTTTRRTVNVTAGNSSTFMASLGALGAAGGWVSINVPLELQVMEGGTLLGTTKAERIMLPTGRHELVLVDATLGFQQTVPVDIEAGKTVTTSVNVPNGSVSVNALPWANVWLDNQSLGTTPLANLQIPLGTHEVIWRHPQLGERRQAITVTTKAPVRVVMDLNKR